MQPFACGITVFAKAPVPGYAKTRLIPALGANGAAALAERLLHHTLASACAADVGPVELCCAPDARHQVFLAYAREFGITLTVQKEGELGDRMADAAYRGLARTGSVIIAGTDCPALDALQFSAAAHALRTGHDAVCVPAVDGGYVLLGLQRFDPHLFGAIPWNTARVMSETRKRMTELAWHWTELPMLPDIDTPADLVHLPATLL
jgi:hypothetical protein